MRKYAAESIFAADLPHTSKRQKQSAADLRQKDSSRGSSKLVCGKYAAGRLFIHLAALKQSAASMRQKRRAFARRIKNEYSLGKKENDQF